MGRPWASLGRPLGAFQPEPVLRGYLLDHRGDRQEAEESAKRQRAREAEAESTDISEPKRKRIGEAAAGGKNGDRALL
ncbi:unnamed protein product [Ectocarpus sp. CCAP 1310/34]|nr:unnamed protein product [Ectocarpus sp. CCAP 1310/34]